MESRGQPCGCQACIRSRYEAYGGSVLKTKDEVGNDFSTMYQQQWQRRLREHEEQYKKTAEFEKTLKERQTDVLKEMDLDLAEAWQGATDLVYGDFRDKYVWTQNNPFHDVAMPLTMAMDFINRAGTMRPSWFGKHTFRKTRMALKDGACSVVFFRKTTRIRNRYHAS